MTSCLGNSLSVDRLRRYVGLGRQTQEESGGRGSGYRRHTVAVVLEGNNCHITCYRVY